MTFEEMKEELYKREEEAMNDRDTADGDEYLDGVFDGLHEAAKLVSITDPVRHGRWEVRLDARRFCECSICGFRPEYKYNYCPICGAKMKESDD